MSDNCIKHVGLFNRKGHGLVTYDGKTDYAHRVVLKKIGVQLGPKDLVHHKCHNKWCINPTHLEIVDWGVHSHYHNRGEANSQAVLTEEDVLYIRMIRDISKISYSKIANRFNSERGTKITKDTVVKICTRKTWKHI